MANALQALPASTDQNLLVGFNNSDDAGVYKISDDTALVQTVDFFPPIVDDPFSFGQIAVANALSDIYAMGARPLTVLNIIGFPHDTLPASVMTDILKGGADKVKESGAVVVGGHSIKDKELKFGASVTGIVHPDKIITNGCAKAGDKLYLTKKLGTGIITTGIKQGKVSDELTEVVIRQMKELNKEASEIMVAHNVLSATDVTGFGLMGHAFEMAKASNVTIRFEADKLPIIDGVLELAGDGVVPGGTKDNIDFMDGRYSFSDNIDNNLKSLLFDPQTSGGLLIAVAENNCESLEKALKEKQLCYESIGVVEEKSDKFIIVE